jgi:hypothetical protein
MPEIEEKYQYEIFAVLGEFVNTFANAETILHVFLRTITGMKDRDARLVFDRWHFHDLITTSRDLVKISELSDEQKNCFEDSAKKFLEINIMRRNLVHRWGWMFSDRIHTTNQMIEPGPKPKGTGLPFGDIYSMDDITNASKDLAEIIRRMQWIMNPASPFGVDLTRSWLYTP